ncbi:MAG: efflux RND transporter periplasmic adaptor subunit [Rhizobiaceae bacterium]|nr:efflux RND transporter periplasmic adaptor subunit [Rhizobiaceae bacterium]
MNSLTIVLIAFLVLLPGLNANTIALAAETNTSAVVEFEGTVVPSREAEITPIVSGWLENINFVPGQIVRKGDVLFEFHKLPSQLRIKLAEAQLAAALASLNSAEAKLARATKLKSRNIVSVADFDLAKAARDMADAIVEQAKATIGLNELGLMQMTQIAPFSGMMSEPLVKENGWKDIGGSGRDGITMAVLTQLDPILVASEVPYSIYAARRKIFKTDEAIVNGLVLQIILPGGEIYPHEGKLVSGGYKFDEDTQKLKVWAEFANPDRLLRPGLKVTIRSRLATSNPD